MEQFNPGLRNLVKPGKELRESGFQVSLTFSYLTIRTSIHKAHNVIKKVCITFIWHYCTFLAIVNCKAALLYGAFGICESPFISG